MLRIASSPLFLSLVPPTRLLAPRPSDKKIKIFACFCELRVGIFLQSYAWCIVEMMLLAASTPFLIPFPRDYCGAESSVNRKNTLRFFPIDFLRIRPYKMINNEKLIIFWGFVPHKDFFQNLRLNTFWENREKFYGNWLKHLGKSL